MTRWSAFRKGYDTVAARVQVRTATGNVSFVFKMMWESVAAGHAESNLRPFEAGTASLFYSSKPRECSPRRHHLFCWLPKSSTAQLAEKGICSTRGLGLSAGGTRREGSVTLSMVVPVLDGTGRSGFRYRHVAVSVLPRDCSISQKYIHFFKS